MESGQISGVESDRSADRATTSALIIFFWFHLKKFHLRKNPDFNKKSVIFLLKVQRQQRKKNKWHNDVCSMKKKKSWPEKSKLFENK